MSTIVFAGDSITAPQYVTEAETFARQIGEALGFTSIINSAVSGQKASGILSNVESQVLSHSPSACVVMVGTNDLAAAWENSTPNNELVAQYLASMEGIIDSIKGAGIHLTVLSPPMTKRPEEGQRIGQMVFGLADICYRKGVSFLDIAGAMAANARNTGTFFDWFLPVEADKYHLNAVGHKNIADLFLTRQIRLPRPEPLPAEVGPVLSSPITGTFGSCSGKTVRCRVVASLLSVPVSGFQRIRFKLQAGGEPLLISRLYAGPLTAGYAASYLVPLTVFGASGFTIPAGGAMWTDWATMPVSGATGLVWSFYCGGGPAMDAVPANDTITGAATAIKVGDEAVVLAPGGLTGYDGYQSLVSAIETDGH